MARAELSLLALLLPVAAVLLFLMLRAMPLRAALASVPVRIHVGGTRGKTTVCRLIAAALESGGIRTLAKTTGTEPMLILPDGTERPWRRAGPPTIGEQRRFALLAARLGAEATVLECMAIRPELVRACERDLVRATVAVLTNVRPDHLEDMHSLQAIADSQLGFIPANGVLVAAEEALSQTLRERAAALGTAVVAVPTAGLGVPDANQAIALAVCRAVGSTAPESFRMEPDPGAFSVVPIMINGRRFRFANAFACNDVVSLDRLRRERAIANAPAVVLLNHRNDRPLRSLQFLDYVASLPERPGLLLAGATPWLRRAARLRGLNARAIAGMPWTDGIALLERVAAEIPDDAMVWGVGNYRGRGAAIVRALRGLECSR